MALCRFEDKVRIEGFERSILYVAASLKTSVAAKVHGAIETKSPITTAIVEESVKVEVVEHVLTIQTSKVEAHIKSLLFSQLEARH